MLSKAIAFLAIVAAASAGAVTYLANPHVGVQSESTVRGFAGLSSVSNYAKAVDSPFSSVRKTDTRVTNDASFYAAAPVAAAPVAYAAAPVAAPVAYAAPVAAAPAYAAAPVAAAPAYAHYAAPAPAVAYASKTISAGPAYAAPVAKVHAAPVAYAAPVAPVAYGYQAAPVAAAYHAPAVAKVAPAGLLGVAYSAVSPAVATLNFNGYGISYGY